MNGFEKVFKDGRAGGLHLRIPNKPRRSTCPSIRAMEAELKKLKEESFAMKCTLKATDTVVRNFSLSVQPGVLNPIKLKRKTRRASSSPCEFTA